MFKKTVVHNSYIISIYQEFISLVIPFVALVAGVAILDMTIRSFEDAKDIYVINSNSMVDSMVNKVAGGTQFTTTES